DLRNSVDGGVGGGPSAMNSPEFVGLEQLPRRLHQCRQWAVRLIVQEPGPVNDVTAAQCRELGDQAVQCIGASDVNRGHLPQVALRPCWDHDWNNTPVPTLAVVALKVSGIRGGLVEVSLRWLAPALELNDQHAVAGKEDGLRPSGLHR